MRDLPGVDFSDMSDESFDVWFDGWFDSLSVAELDSLDQVTSIAGVPEEWRDEIIRAYTVFGADEFGGLFGGRIPIDIDELKERVKKQFRDPTSGRFRDMITTIGDKVTNSTGKIAEVRAKITGKADNQGVPDLEQWRGKPVDITPDQQKTLDGFDPEVKKFLTEAVDRKMVAPEGEEIIPSKVKRVSRPGRVFGAGTEEDPINVRKDYARAMELIAAGKHVRLNNQKELSVLRQKYLELMESLEKNPEELKKMGELNFCNVTVKGSSIWCAEHEGFPRIIMPQGKGKPRKGSLAAESRFLTKESKEVMKRAKLDEDGYPEFDDNGHMIDKETGGVLKASKARLDKEGNFVLNKDGKYLDPFDDDKTFDNPYEDEKPAELESDGMELFDAILLGSGYRIVNDKVVPSNLKATQSQIAVDKVLGMSKAIDKGKWDTRKAEGILIGADGSVIDGHHTWAAQLLADLKDGAVDGKVNGQDHKLNVRVIKDSYGNAVDSLELLEFMNKYSHWFGILPKGAGKGSAKGPR